MAELNRPIGHHESLDNGDGCFKSEAVRSEAYHVAHTGYARCILKGPSSCDGRVQRVVPGAVIAADLPSANHAFLRTRKLGQSLWEANDAQSHASVSIAGRDGVRAQKASNTPHRDEQASGRESLRR